MRERIIKFAQDVLDEGEGFSYDYYHDEEIDSDTYGDRVDWALSNYQEDEEAKAWLEANDLLYLAEEGERHEETSAHARQFLPVFQTRSAELLDRVFSDVRLEIPDAVLGDVGEDGAGVSNVERSFEGAWDLRNTITIVSPANDSYTIPVVTLRGSVGVLLLDSISGFINNYIATTNTPIRSEDDINRLFDDMDSENYEKAVSYFVEGLRAPDERNRLSESNIEY